MRAMAGMACAAGLALTALGSGSALGSPPGGLDFATRHTAAVSQGWSAGPCPGAIGPVRCMFRSGTMAGPVFLDTFRKNDVGILRGTRTVGDLQRAFRAIARQTFAEFSADRQQFCPAYRAVREPVVARTVAGTIGVRWSESLLRPDGTVDEQLVHFIMVRDGMEYLLWAEAVADDACFPEELTHWLPGPLHAARHPLDLAVARARLPRP